MEPTEATMLCDPTGAPHDQDSIVTQLKIEVFAVTKEPFGASLKGTDNGELGLVLTGCA